MEASWLKLEKLKLRNVRWSRHNAIVSNEVGCCCADKKTIENKVDRLIWKYFKLLFLAYPS